MRITFNEVNQPKIQKDITTYVGKETSSVKETGNPFNISASLDDSKTYEGSKKSINEFRDSLKSIDVQANQDYMAVMSGCMSDEDFANLLKNGGNPGNTEIKDVVTTMDRIKLAVAQSGKSVEGFTDTLDSETIEAMTGLHSLESFANEEDVSLDKETCAKIKEAYEQVSDITSLTDGMKKYFVASDAPVTIDNLYMSKHSVCDETLLQGSDYFSVETKGYLVKKAETSDISELETEIKDLLSKENMDVTKENVESGVWLVKNSLPVTKENIEKLSTLESLSLPLTEQKFSKAVVIGISEGKEPKDADVTKEESIYNQAIRITGEIEELIDTPFITATRILEETRLKMTTEANLMLLKSDYHIDTKDMESYVEALKKLEETQEFKEAKEMVSVEEKVNLIKKAPVAIIGAISKTIDSMTLEEVAESSLKEILKAVDAKKPGDKEVDVKEANVHLFDNTSKYAKAMETYEAVGTEVRKDLGDSIRKAFSNVPKILEEMNLPVTKENERAVRILGYNSLPVTKENIEEIKEADKKLLSVINRITPKDTLALIRQGNSPINLSVEELNKYLDEKEDPEKEQIEKYSKFLYKLEQDKDITPEERKDYIEVYRFFHQIEKTESAAIGSVLFAGQELTMSNLKTAMKTTKHRGMDVTVGEVYEVIANASEDLLEQEWVSHKYQEMKQALKAPEETVTELLMNNVSVTTENLEAALLLRKNRGEAFNKASKASGGKAKERAVEMSSKFDNREDTLSEYEEMVDECKSAVYEECLMRDSYMDVRALQLTHMQLSVARSYASTENYEVPMEIGGKVTSVNVKLVHNSMEDPNVVISFDSEDLGRVSARLSKEKNDISGYISCNLKDTVSKMQKVADKVSTRISVVWSQNSDTDLTLSRIPMKNNEETNASELYSIAKEFLNTLKGTIYEN